MSAGIYVLSLLVVDMMSKPSNTKSSGGGLRPGRNCRGKKHVNLGALLSSSSLSSLSSLGASVGAGAGAGAGAGGVQWF